MSPIQAQLDELRAIAWAQHRVRFTATHDPETNSIFFSSFGRWTLSMYESGELVPPSQKGAGAKVLAAVCEIADHYGAEVRLRCYVPKLINGLYADCGFVDSEPTRISSGRHLIRHPHTHTLQPRNPANVQHVPA